MNRQKIAACVLFCTVWMAGGSLFAQDATVPATAPVLTAEQKEPYITAAWTYNSLLAQKLSIEAQFTQSLLQLQIQEAVLRSKCGDKAELTGLDAAKPACTLKPVAAPVVPAPPAPPATK